MNTLNFIKIQSSGQVADSLAKLIGGQLSAGRNVLWLLSGGSSAEPAVGASKLLTGRDLGGLTISLADERYGDVGHKDSNWQNLMERGFEPGKARLYPLLRGLGPGQTTAEFNQFLETQLGESNFKLALLGIGPDGHTAGILPDSPAVDSNDYAVYYQAGDYRRITITPKAMRSISEAVVYCRGPEKTETLSNLERDLPIKLQPAQIIKQIPKVYVYNDVKGAAE